MHRTRESNVHGVEGEASSHEPGERAQDEGYRICTSGVVVEMIEARRIASELTHESALHDAAFGRLWFRSAFLRAALRLA